MDISLSTPADAIKFKLSDYEYSIIRTHLGRNPNFLELEIYALLWSEHASYKSSQKWIKEFLTPSQNVLKGPLTENAGVVDLGNGLACVVKLESHNHPCSIQPKLGAFTGLRVANRDVFSMGAKPLAYLSALRFGDSKMDTPKWMYNEAVSGLAEFENSFNVPVVGSDIYFSSGFNTNPVVNNMVVGVVAKEKLITSSASKIGSLIMIIGSGTGRDGIVSDSFSADFIVDGLEDTKQLSFNQMTNAKIENELFEAVDVLNSKGLVLALQTVGAQGIIGAAAEMAAKGNSCVSLDIIRIPTYEEEITPRELLISQTWGRMLLNIEASNLIAVQELLNPLHLVAEVVGVVKEGNSIECIFNDEIIVNIPAKSVGLGGDAPINILPFHEPKSSHLRKIDIDQYPEPDHYPNVVKQLIHSPDFLANSAFYLVKKQDVKCLDNPLIDFPSDACCVNLDGNKGLLAFSLEGNPYYCDADSYIGTQIAFFTAALDLACSGAKPIAAVDCLNFGSPFNRDVYGHFIASVKAIAEAAKRINTPIIGGNVSFFNQRSEEGKIVPIAPSPVVGMVGFLSDKRHHKTISFKHKGDMIFLIGKARQCINSSEYARCVLNVENSAVPYFSFDEEVDLLQVITQLNGKNLARSMHRVGKGGLFFALLESALPLHFGFEIITDAEIRKDAFLFGEGQGRVVVSVAPEKEDQFVDYMMEMKFPFLGLGQVTQNEITVDDETFGDIDGFSSKINKAQLKWIKGEM